MPAVANFKSPKFLMAICLLVILVANIFYSMHTTELVSPTNMALSNTMDFSSEYLETLRKDILASKQNELVDEIKEELRKKLYKEQEAQAKKEVDKEFRPEYEKKVSQELEASLTQQYIQTYKLNYGFIEDMAAEYLKENLETIKKLSLLELTGSLASITKEESTLVETEINEVLSRKKWFQFVLRDVISGSAPKLDALTKKERGDLINDCGFIIDPRVYDKNYLSRVKLSPERMSDFKESHGKIFQRLNMMDPPSRHIFHGKGIVISGGGSYTAGALVSIIQVRETGSKLPIELILNDESEYDKQICEDLGARFNFKCVIMEKEIGAGVLKDLKITKFQAKIMGILASSFDHVICLDADNMALKNPDDLFTSAPYLESEFLLWPDLWHRTISPLYYELAGIEYGQVVKRGGISNSDNFFDYARKGYDGVHFHDLEGLPDTRSTETGQMVFSKTKHYKSFLLALYYNVYGKSHYWPLFYQGSPGSGDRDTFVPALHVFNEPYHVVKQSTWLAGFDKKDGNFQETTIVQYDPSTSSEWDRAWKKWLKSKNYDSRLFHYQNNDLTRELINEFKKQENRPETPQVFFLHIHRPKINFVEDTASKNYFEWDQQRNLGKPGRYKEVFGNSDWDLKFYYISQWLACNGVSSQSWWKSVNREQKTVCERISAYVKLLENDTEDTRAKEFTTFELNH